MAGLVLAVITVLLQIIAVSTYGSGALLKAWIVTVALRLRKLVRGDGIDSPIVAAFIETRRQPVRMQA